MYMIKSSYKKGFGLVEVVIAAAIISVVIGAVITAASSFLTTSIRNTSDVKTGYLLEEGVEALKIMRDASFSAHIDTLSDNTPYYVYWTGSTWRATTSTSTIDSIFYRTISLSSVYRNGSDDISSSGTLDEGMRKATVTVAWFDTSRKATTTKSLVTYIADLFTN